MANDDATSGNMAWRIGTAPCITKASDGSPALGKCVIVPVSHRSKYNGRPVKCDVKMTSGKKHIIYYQAHAVELALAVTFYKLQSRTLRRVILDVNRRSKNNPKCNVNFEAFYVGISRVRHGNDLRFAPLHGTADFSHLRKLGPHADVAQYFSGFAHSGSIRTAMPCAGGNRNRKRKAP